MEIKLKSHWRARFFGQKSLQKHNKHKTNGAMASSSSSSSSAAAAGAAGAGGGGGAGGAGGGGEGTLHPYLDLREPLSTGLWYVVSDDQNEGGNAATGSIPSLRLGHAAVAVADNASTGSKRYLVLGGATPDGLVDDGFELDVEKLVWSKLPADKLSPFKRFVCL